MLKILVILFFFFSTSLVWGEAFYDGFEREDNDELENDWKVQTDGTITIEIVDNEALISGTQATDWQRSGLFRSVEEETKVYFDFLANDKFNVHLRLDDEGSGSYIDIYAPPGGSFSYAALSGGDAWPGWTAIPGSNTKAGQYNNFGVEKDGDDLLIILNEKEILAVEHPNLRNITKILIASDAAAGTKGSL
ncbi:hypothetical protein GF312_20635, partial [Candidatus Poribacteria bacterium]|nr:hypothetical protein [Candidatus Poribacteria bacterium]